MRVKTPIVKSQQGELKIDRECNEKDMYLFSIDGKRITEAFRLSTLQEYWKKNGCPNWNVKVELCWKEGNARLVTKYNY